jgi:hypothetical protein
MALPAIAACSCMARLKQGRFRRALSPTVFNYCKLMMGGKSSTRMRNVNVTKAP